MAADELFCLHCHTYHKRIDMVLLPTRAGKRWRCIKSLPDGRQKKALLEARQAQLDAEKNAGGQPASA